MALTTNTESLIQAHPHSNLNLTKQSNCLHCGEPATQNSKFCCSACSFLYELESKGQLEALKLVQETPSQENPYSSLDRDSFEFVELQKNRQNPESSLLKARFYVEGLQCVSCVHLLEKFPEYLDLVQSARLDFSRSMFEIEFKPSSLKEAVLSKSALLIDELGYKAHILKNTDLQFSQEKRNQIENRNWLKLIAITGACASNIMLLSFSVYSGLSGNLERIFSILSFIIFLPVMFYSAQSFYRGALNSLRFGVLSIDLPISLALVTGFIFSTQQLIIGSKQIYFDSMASFLFLILVSRYFLAQTQMKFQRLQGHLDYEFSDAPFEVLTPQGSHFERAEKINIGETIKLRAGQRLMHDSILQTQSAQFDASVVSGESIPQVLMKGMLVRAGFKLLSPVVHVQVQQSLQNSDYAQIRKEIELKHSQKTIFSEKSDKLSQYLVAAVFLTSGLFAFLAQNLSWSERIARILALNVVACPCALAFGAPLAYALMTQKARRLGIYIKTPDFFERALQVKNIFFDKTSTLSFGELELKEFKLKSSRYTESQLKGFILSVESKSLHPIAFALRKVWPNEIIFPVQNYTEKSGNISAELLFQEHRIRVEIKRNLEFSEFLKLQIWVQEDLCAEMTLEDDLRPEAFSLMQKLRQMKFNLFILSGDQNKRVALAAQDLGIEKYFAECTPQDKELKLKSTPNSMMIGDGYNDVLAMQAATASVSVQKSTPMSLKASDVYLNHSHLFSIYNLITIVKQTHYLLLINIFISLAYNIVAAYYSLIGYIDPFKAAVLMPVSSFLLIASSFLCSHWPVNWSQSKSTNKENL